MKKYRKTYEDVFTSERRLKYCKIDNVSNNIDISEKEYRKKMSDLFKDQQNKTFDFLVKYYWLSRRFCYDGKLRSKFSKNGYKLDRPYGIYLRHFVGVDSRLIVSRLNGRVISYFDEFFPDLDAENPFKKKFRYPYKYMNFECLSLVYAMPERLELLKEGERKRLKYTEFIDYVYNYACSVNEERGEVVFGLIFSYKTNCPYVRYYPKEQAKASNIYTRQTQLPPSKPISTESPVKGFADNYRPAEIERPSGA